MEAFFFLADALVTAHAALLALRLPTMAQELGVVRSGALAGYGPDFRAIRASPCELRRPAFSSAAFPAIFPSKPSDQPALAINLKTAKAIGLDIPPCS